MDDRASAGQLKRGEIYQVESEVRTFSGLLQYYLKDGFPFSWDARRFQTVEDDQTPAPIPVVEVPTVRSEEPFDFDAYNGVKR